MAEMLHRIEFNLAFDGLFDPESSKIPVPLTSNLVKPLIQPIY